MVDWGVTCMVKHLFFIFIFSCFTIVYCKSHKDSSSGIHQQELSPPLKKETTNDYSKEILTLKKTFYDGSWCAELKSDELTKTMETIPMILNHKKMCGHEDNVSLKITGTETCKNGSCTIIPGAPDLIIDGKKEEVKHIILTSMSFENPYLSIEFVLASRKVFAGSLSIINPSIITASLSHRVTLKHRGVLSSLLEGAWCGLYVPTVDNKEYIFTKKEFCDDSDRVILKISSIALNDDLTSDLQNVDIETLVNQEKWSGKPFIHISSEEKYDVSITLIYPDNNIQFSGAVSFFEKLLRGKWITDGSSV